MNAFFLWIERFLLWLGLRSRPGRLLANRARGREVAAVRRELDADDTAFGTEMQRRSSTRPHVLLGHVGDTPYVLPLQDLRGAHAHFVGQPGAGKTRLLTSMLAQLLELMWFDGVSYSIVVIDPKGETALLFMRAIAEVLGRRPVRDAERLARRIITIRPFKSAFLTPLPGLQPDPAVDLFAQARVMVELAEHVSGARVGVRQGPAGTFGLAALIANGASFVEAPFLLRDPEAMRALAERVDEPRLQAYFRTGEYARESRQTIGGLVARLEAILGVTPLRAMFAGAEPIDFRSSMQPGMVTIVDLDGAPLGAQAIADAVGALIMTRASWAAFDQNTSDRAAGTLFVIDELARIAVPSVLEAVERVLTTGRWLGVSMWSAAQFASQVPDLDRLLSANTRLRAFGRSSAREIEGAAAEWLPVTGRRLRPRKLGATSSAAEFMSEAEEVRDWVRRIARLPQRHFLVADRSAPFAARILEALAFDPPIWSEVPPEVRALVERGRAGVLREQLVAASRELEARAAQRLLGSHEAAPRRSRRREAPELPDLASERAQRSGRRRREVP